MIEGENIEVRYSVSGEKDKFGNAEISYSDWKVQENVIAYVDNTDTEGEGFSPNLVGQFVTFLFPKSYEGASLKGAQIQWHGHIYSVQGEPEAFPCRMCPTQWSMKVTGKRYG